MSKISQCSDSPCILLIRLSAIGDIVIASLLLQAIREAAPKAHICWLVEDRFASMLEHNPNIDRLYIFPRKRWRELFRQGKVWTLLSECWTFSRQLRQANFDWAFDIQGLLKSGVWAWVSGAKQRVGLGSKEGSQYFMTETLSRQTQDKQLGTEYIKLAKYLGIEKADYPTGVIISEQAKTHAHQLISEYGLQNGFIALCPFTTRPQKHWFNARWSELADVLNDKLGLPIIILGSPADNDAGNEIKAASSCHIHNLCGKTSLQQAGGILSQASLVIGVDTGLTHLGIVLQRKTIALFGSTRPYFDTRSQQAKVIYNPYKCSPCRRNPTCDGRFDCMDSIHIEQIMRVADELQEQN